MVVAGTAVQLVVPKAKSADNVVKARARGHVADLTAKLKAGGFAVASAWVLAQCILVFETVAAAPAAPGIAADAGGAAAQPDAYLWFAKSIFGKF